MTKPAQRQQRDAVSRLLLAVGSVCLLATFLQAGLHFFVSPLFEPMPEYGTAGFVLLVSRSVYGWLRKRDEHS